MKVYIAGPYSKGNTTWNISLAIHAADEVLAAGHKPFIPHLYHYWDKLIPHDREDWMELCLSWLAECNALIRIPGESKGADREVELAAELHIPVFLSLEDFLEAAPTLEANTKQPLWSAMLREQLQL